MNLTALLAEFDDIGFARLTTARKTTLINRAIHELDEIEPWPYRETSVTGVAPLIVSDLGEVEEVFDASLNPDVPLERRSYAELVNDYGDLSTVGSPWFWYRATPAGVTQIATYPVSTHTIAVQYWRVGPDLSAGADTPLAPARFHFVIMLIAERMCHASKGDKGSAEAVQVEIERAVQRMRVALLPDDQPAGQLLTYASEDW